MAAFKILISCLIFLLEVASLDRKRTGGSRGARGARSRSAGPYSRVRSYHNVVLSGRIVTGSSPFTSLTWRSAAIVGSIYGGRAYILNHPHETSLPPICTNNKERSPEGRAFGYFICPREQEPDDFKYCCGAESREYCCNKTMAQIFFSERRRSGGSSTGIVIGVLAAVIVIIVVGTYCCKKRKHAEQLISKFSKRDRRKPPRMPLRPPLGMMQPQFGKGATRHVEENGHTAVDLKRPAESFEGTGLTPSVPPPPSYNAATTSALGGYDAATAGLPYSPPQPQSPHPFDEEKSSLLLPAGDAETLIPSVPHQNGSAHSPLGDVLPYSLLNEVTYQPTPDALYSPSGGAPYLPISDAPYSSSNITTNSPGDLYTTLTFTPYSPLSGNSQPPSTGDPYS